MSLRRVALIYNDRPRPETTGFYCRRALGTLVDVEHFLPTEIATIPRDQFDLYLNIDDGLSYNLPDNLAPKVWWAIDTHIDLVRCADKASEFDLVYSAQRDGVARLADRGIDGARWLPLACDPEVHAKHDIAKTFDVCFVGNVFPGQRAELLELIRRRFPKTYIGKCYFEDMARAYSESRVVFNRSIRNDVNMRVFEGLASGSLLVTNDLSENGQTELFQESRHLVTYRDPEELIDKVQFYLKNESVREKIAATGREEVCQKHTYRHRMEQILKDIEHATAATSVVVTSNAWSRDHSYFSFARPEILAMVPEDAIDVLDVGCGAGKLGQSIKQRQPAQVTGIELDAKAAKFATERLDAVHVGNVEEMELSFSPEQFDAIICGDILEHLRNPLEFLRRAHRWLKSDGCFIASIPNVRHHSVVRMLLEGNWSYESAGLLDEDHVRFFTRREIEKLFYRAGFSITETTVVPGPGYQEWADNGRPDQVRVGALQIPRVPVDQAIEFYAYQYLLRAVPKEIIDYGTTSIVIVTHNEISFTRKCVDSIRQYTDEAYELIFVDNASTDGTVEYLRSMTDIKFICNADNRGFPAAANQGIQASSGRQVLLLNNDTVVTTGWLDRLLRALYRHAKIGLVGPCSNCISGDQQIDVSYDDLLNLDGFAWERGKAFDNQILSVDRLVGFCLLIRREVIDTIGLLDERFGVGCFEDDDYCLRARQAGYDAVIAQDAFVHHFGSQTFRSSGVDFASLMSENQQKFQEKWNGNGINQQPTKIASLGSNARAYTFRGVKGGGLRLVKNSINLSLCMIVRDSSRTIEACLESIKPWVDEMIVVDTGSKDNTADIAKNLGARVYHFPWCDSFAIARNESLRHARGNWIFWMDSDDTINKENGRKLRILAHGKHRDDVFGYIMQVHCPGSGDEAHANVTVVDHVKLIRNQPELRFEGRIHEQILPAIRRQGGTTEWTDIFVVHSGYDHSARGQEKKKKRDLHLLHLELQENPTHPFTLFNLGMTYADIGDHREAVDFLKRCIAQSDDGESHVRKAYSLLVFSLCRAGKTDEACSVCEKGLQLFPTDVELRFRCGVLHHEFGRLQEAVDSFQDLLQNKGERHFTSVDRGIRGFKARQNLAVVYTDMGKLDKAEEEWRKVVEEMPMYRPGWRGLGDALLAQQKFNEAETLAGRMQGSDGRRSDVMILKARIAAAKGNSKQAQRLFQDAVTKFPDDPEVLNTYCWFLFDQRMPDEALMPLKQLIRLDPKNASAHHNLGSVYIQLHQPGEAVRSFKESLRYRADSVSTHLQLGYALRGMGKFDEAEAAFMQALRYDPHSAEAKSALKRADMPVT